MKNDETTVVYPFKHCYSDKANQTLYKILQNNRLKQNKLLMYTRIILTYINENMIDCSNGISKSIIKLLSSLIGISSHQLDVIMKFMIEDELIEISEFNIQLTVYGKLFLISDDISCTVDMIRYYWEKCNWNEICHYHEHNEFLNRDARRYFACLLSQQNNIIDFKDLKSKYGNIDLIYLNNFFIAQEMLDSKSLRHILKYVFEPMGLLKITFEEDKFNLRLTKSGKNVFNYYSYNMIEEYHKLLDECWESYDKGNFQEAYEMAKSIISVDCNLPEAYNVIGCVHIKKNEYETAQTVFNFALDICDKYVSNIYENKSFNIDMYISIYYNLGLCNYYMGCFINALHIFMDIKKTVPYSLENVDRLIGIIKEKIIIQ